MNGPYVIRCGATGAYLGNGGRIVFRKAQARGFSLKSRAEEAFRKERKSPDTVIGRTNPLGWVILPKADAVDLSL